MRISLNKGLLDQLGRVDVKVEEEDQALLLLTLLLDSFEHMITTLLYSKDTLQMGEVDSVLLSNEKTTRKVEDNSGSALLACGQNRREMNVVKGSSSNGRSKSKDCRKRVQCYKCKEWRHIKRDCLTWD